MTALRSISSLVGATALGALLGGCGGGAAPSNLPTQSLSQTSAVESHVSLSETLLRRDGASAGLSAPAITGGPVASAAGARVFSTSAEVNDVYSFAYATGKLLGSFGTGLSEPQGLCNEKKTVWVANTADSNLLQFSKAGKPLGTLADTGQFPVSCASDKQGDVAAANIISTSGGAGSVSIWAGGRGSPKNYPVTDMSRVYFITYDARGDVFVDGSNASGAFALAELPKGASSFKALTVSGAAIGFPGGVQFADGALAIGDQESNGVIYQTHVSNSTATVVGSTTLNSAGDVAQFCITKFKTVIADSSNGLELFAYPAGGNSIRAFGSASQGLSGCAVVY
jgi:hypothetical protein